MVVLSWRCEVGLRDKSGPTPKVKVGYVDKHNSISPNLQYSYPIPSHLSSSYLLYTAGKPILRRARIWRWNGGATRSWRGIGKNRKKALGQARVRHRHPPKTRFCARAPMESRVGAFESPSHGRHRAGLGLAAGRLVGEIRATEKEISRASKPRPDFYPSPTPF